MSEEQTAVVLPDGLFFDARHQDWQGFPIVIQLGGKKRQLSAGIGLAEAYLVRVRLNAAIAQAEEREHEARLLARLQAR